MSVVEPPSIYLKSPISSIQWIELSFHPDGSLDRSPLKKAPEVSGVYAIASRKQNGLYVTHYVGRFVSASSDT